MQAQNPNKAASVRGRGRPRKKNIADTPLTNERVPPPMPRDDGNSSAWLTNFANFALLVAIFTIVFAAHRAMQCNKEAVPPRIHAETKAGPVTTEQRSPEQISVATPPAQDVGTGLQKPETHQITANEEKKGPSQAMATSQPEADESAKAEQVKKEGPAVREFKKKRTVKNSVRKSIYHTDPYTDGGPLDLDRRGPELTDTAKIERPQINSRVGRIGIEDYTDHKNPWNSGTHMDLDSESARAEYKRNSYSYSKETVTKTPEAR